MQLFMHLSPPQAIDEEEEDEDEDMNDEYAVNGDFVLDLSIKKEQQYQHT